MTRRVAVVFGGASVEREVSLVSARTIVQNLPPDRYRAVPMAVDAAGNFFGEDDSRRILEDGLPAATGSGPRLPADVFEGIDIAFPIVHGETGEDGTIQGFFETAGLPYVGSDVGSSALGMNKAAFKTRMRDAGLPVARSIAFTRAEHERRPGELPDLVARRFAPPVFVKPSGGGSSLGVSKVKAWEDLADAVALAFEYDRTILVEEGLTAREIECAMLGNDVVEASGCGEIVPGREFYDYDDKYLSEGARLLIPAPIDAATESLIRDISVRAFEICGCSGMARVDFFLDRASGAVFLNELNTIPGFTSISMYPKLWSQAGISLADLLDRLVRLGFERAEKRRVDFARRRLPGRL